VAQDHEEEETPHEPEIEGESSSQGHEGEEEPSLQEVEPTHGTHELRNGFSRSPREIEVQAGGSVSGLELTGLMNCTGFFEETADIRLNYRAGEEGLLRVYVDDPTDQDTSLTIYGPDNTWLCNDDYDLTLQPVIDFQSPLSGDYDVYVGHYFADTITGVILYLTEDAEVHRPALPLSGLNND
jgi:hypothetical protein